MNTFIISFIMTEVFVLVSSAALLGKLRYYFSTQVATVKFKNLVKAFCIYLIADIFWALIVYGGLPKSYIVVHLLSICEFILMGIIPYFWFLYVEEILETQYFRRQVLLTLFKTVMIIYGLLVITSFKTGYIYNIDSEYHLVWGEQAKVVIISLLMLFFGSATIQGIINLISSKNKIIIRKSIMVIGFVIPIALIIVLYHKYRLAICVPQAIFTAILLYFFSLEDQMSYVDELTGLFNRKKLKLLQEEGKLSASNQRLNHLFYVDVNDFKEINDNYGHLEGDVLLKILGQAFKNLDTNYHAVSIRTGGDEFLIAVSDTYIKGLDFKEIIHREIKKVEQAEAFAHHISISIGQATIQNDQQNGIKDCLKAADMDMYQEKCRIKKLKQAE